MSQVHSQYVVQQMIYEMARDTMAFNMQMVRKLFLNSCHSNLYPQNIWATEHYKLLYADIMCPSFAQSNCKQQTINITRTSWYQKSAKQYFIVSM
jgi:hypothetical protein